MENIALLTYYFNLFLAYVGYYLTYVYNIYVGYPFEVKVAALSVCAGLTTIIIITISILVKANRRRKHNKLMEKMENRFGKNIEYLLSAECDPYLSVNDVIREMGIEEDVKKKQNVLKNKKEKLAFCHLLYKKRISDHFVPGRQDNLMQVINLFSLRDFLEGEVSMSSKRHTRDALIMMTTFRLYISPWVINKLLVSKNQYIRRLAMYSSILTSTDSELDYFETDFFDNNCCIHDEIELGYVLQRRRNNGMKLPNLASWAMHQKKPKTKCVFVRLMHRFDQREYCDQLVPLFKESTHKKLIEEISRTWGYLKYTDSEQLLIDSILMQPDDTKVAMMHAMTRMNTGYSIEVLAEEFQYSQNPHVKYEALRCLYNYGENGKLWFEELEKHASEDEKKYFAFFHNPITLDKVTLDKEQAYHPSVETVYNAEI